MNYLKTELVTNVCLEVEKIFKKILFMIKNAYHLYLLLHLLVTVER